MHPLIQVVSEEDPSKSRDMPTALLMEFFEFFQAFAAPPAHSALPPDYRESTDAQPNLEVMVPALCWSVLPQLVMICSAWKRERIVPQLNIDYNLVIAAADYLMIKDQSLVKQLTMLRVESGSNYATCSQITTNRGADGPVVYSEGFPTSCMIDQEQLRTTSMLNRGYELVDGNFLSLQNVPGNEKTWVFRKL